MNHKTKKVCFIASSGGHLEEIKQLNKVFKNFESFYVVADTKSTKGDKNYKYFVNDINRKNILTIAISFFCLCIKELKIYLKEQPDYVITTGPGMTVPLCLIAKIFKKKLIFIESFARINSPSKTGKFLYKYADLFLVQNDNLIKFYPKAIYGGALF